MLAKLVAMHIASFTGGPVMRMMRVVTLASSSPSLFWNYGTRVRNRYENCETNNRLLEMVVTESATESKN
jgi:hypothetical protein